MIFSGNKIISAKFSLIIEYENPQIAVFQVQQCTVTVFDPVIRSFLQDLRGPGKQYLKERLFARWLDEKQFWPIFLVLPSMADLR